jgi:hypothetical protein
MRKELFRYLTILATLLILAACRKEPVAPVGLVTPEGEGWTKVHFRATASGNPGTKATLDGIERSYLFDRDDLLYVVDSDHKNAPSDAVLYGILYLISGADASTAVFEGDLMYFDGDSGSASYKEPQKPADNMAITATLISKQQRDDGFFTFVTDNDGKIATGPNFGASSIADTFSEAVEKYSWFTDDATYGKPSFSLAQQTAFLKFSLLFDNDVTGELSVNMTNNNGAVSLFTHNVTPDTYHHADFVAAFKGGDVTLSNAKVTVTDVATSGTAFNKSKAINSAALQGNRYYNVVKTFLDLSHFTIQAPDGASTEITFLSDYADDIRYSSDGTNWTYASSHPTVTLNNGASVMVEGKRTAYQNTSGAAPLFESTNACFIYGDIMSLFCDANYENIPTAFTAQHALEGTFKGLANIDIHPARPLLLSASTLTDYCYYQTFAGSGITRAPEFADEEGNPAAATIPQYACKWMFKDCTLLAGAMELPATNVAQEGYYGMFSGCTAMATPPASLATTLSGSAACQQMFLGCTSLLYAPDLPALTIPSNGYREMFSGCTSLREGPEIAATTVGESACAYMFGKIMDGSTVVSPACTSMVTGPSQLNATAMSNNCYQGMFAGCTSLEVAPMILAKTLVRKCFSEMFAGCSMLRSIPQAEFAFTNIGDNSCYRMFYMCSVLNGAPNMPHVTGTVGPSGCLEMYAECAQMLTAPAALTATTVSSNGYKQMFFNCKWIKVAPSISATNIQSQGCSQMFQGCIRLETAPANLPATNLGASAYAQMFFGCSALKAIPSFPSTSVTWSGDSVCYQMFQSCTSITELTEPLFSGTSTLRKACFQDMFAHCTSLKTVLPGLLPATTLAQDCYRGMFQDTAITSAPDLKVEVLSGVDCYRYMYYGCKKLSSIRCWATNPSTQYTLNFTGGTLAATGAFYKKGDTSWPTAPNGIPSGWTVISE